MFHSQSSTRSAVSRGIVPQGKGREGIRNGRGEEIFQDQSAHLAVGAQILDLGALR